MPLPLRERLTQALMPSALYYRSRIADEATWGEHELDVLDQIMKPGGTAIDAGASENQLRDVIVRAHDADPLSAHHLAPYEFELSVTTGGVTTPLSTMTLDGKLGHVDCGALYNITGAYKSWAPSNVSAEHRYYFVPTNGGSPPSEAGAWSASPGDHVLHVTIRDVKGNSATINQTIHIP